jgi:hypothetical protein
MMMQNLTNSIKPAAAAGVIAVPVGEIGRTKNQ